MTTFSSFRISRFRPSPTLLFLQADLIIVKSSSVGMFVCLKCRTRPVLNFDGMEYFSGH
jgi:hypothetical protein